MPRRLQRRRTKGWRMPEGAVYVGRPTKWGNPFTVAGYLEVMDHTATEDEARRVCVEAFADWLAGDTWAAGSGPEWEQRRVDYVASIPELSGKDLVCWCPEDAVPCHADVLLELANGTVE